MNSPYLPLTITAIKQEQPDFKTFYFEQKSATTIAYKAGQYLTFLIPDSNPEIRRSYSIISSPVLQEPLAIGVKRIANGVFSRWLIDKARPGDLIFTLGAAGFFTLPLDLQPFTQTFFFAAGSGITPCLALIKTLLFSQPAIKVTLIYSNSSPETTIYYQELQQLKHQFNRQFQIEFLFSNSPDLSRARLRRELVIELVKQFAIAPPENLLAFICGPEIYMRMVNYGLRNAGFLPENIRKETFTSVKQPPKIEPPDTEPHLVKINFRQQIFEIQAQYPDTILAAARKQGLQLPYSCEAGRCGNCVARCTEGNIWMSYNEVLTDRDLKQGLILTCVGHPVGGNAVLKI